jgi:hypothetical protein
VPPRAAHCGGKTAAPVHGLRWRTLLASLPANAPGRSPEADHGKPTLANLAGNGSKRALLSVVRRWPKRVLTVLYSINCMQCHYNYHISFALVSMRFK